MLFTVDVGQYNVTQHKKNDGFYSVSPSILQGRF